MVKQMCGGVKNEAKICCGEHPIQFLERLNNSNNSIGNVNERNEESLSLLLDDSDVQTQETTCQSLSR